MNKERGFTLLEVMVVCIIIAVATGALMFALPSSTQQAEMTQIQELLDNIRKARLVAQRYQQPIVLEIDKTGYRILNAPQSEKNEPWSQDHQWGHAPLSITLQPLNLAITSTIVATSEPEENQGQSLDATLLPPPSTLILGPEPILPETMLRIVTTSRVWSLSNPGGGTFVEEPVP